MEVVENVKWHPVEGERYIQPYKLKGEDVYTLTHNSSLRCVEGDENMYVLTAWVSRNE